MIPRIAVQLSSPRPPASSIGAGGFPIREPSSSKGKCKDLSAIEAGRVHRAPSTVAQVQTVQGELEKAHVDWVNDDPGEEMVARITQGNLARITANGTTGGDGESGRAEELEFNLQALDIYTKNLPPRG